MKGSGVRWNFGWSLRVGAGLWLLLAALLIAAAVRLFGHGIPVQTNLLALLPQTERNPVAEDAVNALTKTAGDRIVLLVGNTDVAVATTAARTLGKTLRANTVFRRVIVDIPPIDPKQLIGVYLPYRYSLLSPADRKGFEQNTLDLDARLQQKLYAPFQFGLRLPLANDPFGLTDAWLASLPLKNLKLDLDNGLLTRRDGDTTWVLISAELAGSAYDDTVQQAAVAAVSAAERELRNQSPSLQLLRTGSVFYAEAARRSGKHEFDMIGAGSLIGMLLLLYFVFRSPRPLLLGLFAVAFGIGAALVCVIGLYGEIHLITLVFGASLIGEAIDYPIQYFAAHLGAGKQWQPLAGLRRIAPGLCIALATSLLGYAVLSLAPFPALKQIALFAIVGLCAAWLTVFLLLPALFLAPTSRDPEQAVALPQKLLTQWQRTMTKRRALIASVALLTLAIPGWLQLHANDDVRQLISRAPELQSQENRIKALTGFDNSSQFFLIEGATPDEVLLREEQFVARLTPLIAQGDISGYQALSSFVPSIERQQANRTLWQNHVFADRPRLHTQLSNAGLKDEVANAQLAAYHATASKALTLDTWLAAPLSTPFRHLWLGKTSHGYASIVLPQGVRTLTALSQTGQGLAGVTYVDKAGSITQLFGTYRHWGSLWLVGAVALVFLVLLMRYPWRQAFLVLTPTLLAMFVALGVFGYLRVPLTLFNLMGLMLVLGIGVNYSIFLREGGVNAAATLAGVALSAGTALLSFGLLAFSSMPALAGFGITLLTGISLAVAFAPMGLTFSDDILPNHTP